jgi:asparagine synthase (glutamine-hydrolysing)
MHMRTATWFERLCARNQVRFADPWADRRLAEFVMAVPQHMLSRAGHNKRILRTAMDGIMPDEDTRRNARKIDPSPLYRRALKAHADKVINHIMSFQQHVQKTVDEKALRSYYRAYTNGEAKDHRFWYALTYGLWMSAQHE